MRWFAYHLAERAMRQPTTNRRKFVDDWFTAELRYVNYDVDGPLVGMAATLEYDSKSSDTDVKWVMANVFRMKRQGCLKKTPLDFNDSSE